MRKLFIGAVVALSLSSPASSKCMVMCGPQRLKERIETMIGQPIEPLFEKLGYPQRKETFGPDTVYYWGTDLPDGPVCTYQVGVGADNLIKNTKVYGNDWGCSMVAKHLKP